MLKFEWQPLSVMLDDGLHELVKAHWDEVGVSKEEMPLAVDYRRYFDLQERRILYLIGAWQDEKLIGYASWFYLPHLHYCTTALAGCDAIYVLKDRRQTGAGIRLIDKSERHFAELSKPGYCRITYHDRQGVELLGPVLRRRGYVAVDTTYAKITRL